MTTVPSIPVIDFSSWSGRDDSVDGGAAAENIAQALTEACQHVGFVYITNHGIPDDVVDEAFNWSRQLFGLALEKKMLAPHPPGPDVHRGYSWPGLEKVSQKIFGSRGADGDADEARELEERKVEDVKESYEIGSDLLITQPNVWLPEEVLPGFRPFMSDFYKRCHAVSIEIIRALAMGLGVKEDAGGEECHILRAHSGINNQLRLLHYPPVEASRIRGYGTTENELGDSRGGDLARMPAHTDWGTITLLFQESVATPRVGDEDEDEEDLAYRHLGTGLQVEDPNRPGRFIDVAPTPYPPTRNEEFKTGGRPLVVNVGDLLMRWSNDTLKSTMHRVTLPPSAARLDADAMLRPRYSIPYFVAPDPDTLVECLPSCCGASNPARYDPIVQDDYRRMRAKGQYR